MVRYIALLRGINVGGQNKIAMPELKAAFEKQGFQKVVTYINSGNIILESELSESGVRTVCEALIEKTFSLKITVCIITAAELAEALSHAPEWWNKTPDAKNNAVFVIPPFTAAEICAEINDTKPEHEKISYYGKVVFWTAPLAAFSKTRLTKIVHKKEYNGITVRNANTTLKLSKF